MGCLLYSYARDCTKFLKCLFHLNLITICEVGIITIILKVRESQRGKIIFIMSFKS